MGKVFRALRKASETDALSSEGGKVFKDPGDPDLIESEEQAELEPIETTESSPDEVSVREASPVEDRHVSGGAPSTKIEVSPPQPVELTSKKTSRAQEGGLDERLKQAIAVTGHAAACIRSLRTRILYPPDGPPLRSLLITSASPGEGASFICANLGISLAKGIGGECIIVDSDLHRPTQHKLFGMSNVQGLTGYILKRQTDVEVIHPSGVDKLWLLPAGTPPDDSTELPGKESVIGAMEQLLYSHRDRILLFDTPPFHATDTTAILAQQVDGVVVVVRPGSTRRELVKYLVETVGKNKIAGVVLNAYSASMLPVGHSPQYNYQRYYNSSKKKSRNNRSI